MGKGKMPRKSSECESQTMNQVQTPTDSGIDSGSERKSPMTLKTKIRNPQVNRNDLGRMAIDFQL
jgi:hypothetical protein